MAIEIKELDVDEFLGHSGGSDSNRTDWLNWKDRGRVDVWLHPAGMPIAVWGHSWYTIGHDRDTGEEKIRWFRFNSMETEKQLRKRFFRSADGSLEYPPELCPFAKLMAWVDEAIRTDVISWTDEIFRIEVPGECITIHAGGFTGAFTQKSVTEAQKREIKRTGIQYSECWKENAQSRLQYLFRTVEHGDPGKGCQVALESQSLGDAVKKVIADRMDDYPDGASAKQIEDAKRKGNPFVNPYAIRFLYYPDRDFKEKYDARPLMSLEMTEEVRAVLEAPAPDISKIAGPSNFAQLRLSFETFWSHEVVPPWDEIFEAAEALLEGTDAVQLPADRSRRVETSDGDKDDSERKSSKAKGESKRHGSKEPTKSSKSKDEEEPAPKATTKAAPKAAPKKEEEEQAGDEEFECDECGGLMKANEYVCPKCGVEYNEDGEIIARPEKPKTTRKRGGK